MKRLGLVLERFDVTLGGAERSVSELADALERRGLDVTVLAATGRVPAGRGCVLCPDRSGRVDLATLQTALRAHLRQHRYDRLHSVLPLAFADVYQPRGGSALETQRRHIASYRRPWLRLFKRLTAGANRRRATLIRAERRLVADPAGPQIAALSTYVAQQFRRHYGCPDERLTVVANGVRPPDAAGEVPVDRPADITVFLLAANNFRLKGLADALYALRRVPDRRRLLLWVAGSGRPGPYRRLARRLGLAEHVRFVGSVSAIGPLLAACDVALLPTYYDPASRFILEALACGKPVITTAFNGACDLMEVPRHGLVVDDPRDHAALAQAIGLLLEPQRRQAIGQAIADDHLIERLSVDRVADELLALYDRIPARRGVSP